MMNFTKEYIELCKDKKIQKLRAKIKFGDWIAYKEDKSLFSIFTDQREDDDEWDTFSEMQERLRKDRTWLPTGDQLDEEIIKTISQYRHYVYACSYYFENKIYSVIIDGSILREYSDTNPLICKLKLLLELLKVEHI